VVLRRYASRLDDFALLRLQIEGKFLSSAKDSVRGEDLDRFIDETLSRNPRGVYSTVGSYYRRER